MSRDKFACRLCKDEETELQVHHKKYINGNAPWEYDDAELITLCCHCHEEINSLKNIPFEKITIYKSDGWKGGGRIMFISHDKLCSMRIYDGNNKFTVGFILDTEDIPSIIKILIKTLKYPSDTE